MTADELARAMGKSVDAARSKARRVGIVLQPKHRGHADATRRRAIRLRSLGMTYQQIEQATGVTDKTVRKWIGEAAA